MKHAMATTVSRRGWLTRLFMAAAVAPVMGMGLADSVHADKKNASKQAREKRIRNKVKGQEQLCRDLDGTPTTDKRPGGTTVSCSGSAAGDYACTVHSKGMRCHSTTARTSPAPEHNVSGEPTGGDQPWQGDVHDNQPTAEPDPSGESDPVLT